MLVRAAIAQGHGRDADFHRAGPREQRDLLAAAHDGRDGQRVDGERLAGAHRPPQAASVQRGGIAGELRRQSGDAPRFHREILHAWHRIARQRAARDQHRHLRLDAHHEIYRPGTRATAADADRYLRPQRCVAAQPGDQRRRALGQPQARIERVGAHEHLSHPEPCARAPRLQPRRGCVRDPGRRRARSRRHTAAAQSAARSNARV